MSFLRSLSLHLIEKSFYLLFFLVPLVMTPLNFELFEFNKMLTVYFLATVIAGAWLVVVICEKRLVFRRTFWDLPLLIFLGSQILSWLFSIDRHTSFFGYYSRFHGGLASTLAYALLYWALVSFAPLFGSTPTGNPLSSGMRFNRLVIRISSCCPFVIKCLVLLLASGLLVSLYGIAEHFGIDARYWVQDVQNRVFSTFGQPNWLAAWLAAIIPLTWGLAIGPKGQRFTGTKAKSKQKNNQRSAIENVRSLITNYLPLAKGRNFDPKWGQLLITLSLFAIFYLCLLYTKSRSGLLAFGVSFLVFWGLYVIKLFIPLRESAKITAPHKKPLTINNQQSYALEPLVIFTFSFFLFSFLVGTPWTPGAGQIFNRHGAETAAPPVAENTPIANYGEGTESGEIRRIVWQGAVDLWRHHPWIGTGPETFAYAYYWYRPREHNDVSEWDFLYNKAHNEYLNLAANTGTVGLATYLGLIVSFFLYIVKDFKRNPNFSISQFLNFSIFAGWLSILVTNFFGFSVVGVALLFFLFPALAVSLNTAAAHPPSQFPKPGYRQAFLIIIVILSTLVTAYSLLNYWLADYYFAEGEKLSSAGQNDLAVTTLQKAVELRPEEPFYQDSLAITAAQAAAAAPADSPLISLAVGASDQTIRLNPYHLNFWKNRVRVFYTLGEIENQYYQEALNSLYQAKSLAPTDAKIYYNLALLYARLGQEDLAVQTLEETIRLKPNYDTARYALALFYEKQGKEDLAHTQYRYILENINPEHEGAKEKLINP